MHASVRVRVTGRPGAGRRTVASALRVAGITVTGPGDADIDVDAYVFVETLNADDRAALARTVRPTVAVLNKADLIGLANGGPMAGLTVEPEERSRELRREVGWAVRPFSALLAVAGNDGQVLDDCVLGAVQELAGGGAIDASARQRLATDLDVFGTALAVAAVREGAGRSGIAALLSRVSGLAHLLSDIDRAAAVVRYRSAVGAAKTAAAHAVLDAAGAPAPPAMDDVCRAVHWHRYARGPVSALHRDCAMDAARGALQSWAQAGGRPAALP